MNPNSVVVDTNLIFSALIPRASQIRELFFENKFTFYSPNFLIIEIYGLKLKGYNNFFNQ